MKFKKKTTMLLAFVAGTLLFSATALADIASKSGYDRLKDSVKFTAEYLLEKADSYTLEANFELKVNGNLMSSDSSITKTDRNAGASEGINTSWSHQNGDYNYYNYSDRKTEIRSGRGYGSDEQVYYVTEYTNERPFNDFAAQNPFREKGADDVERIIDALVGNLRDHVTASENADGSYTLDGALSRSQIPALINAVTSFVFKQSMSGSGFPEFTDDVYVKEVKGTAKINPDGLIENIMGSATVSGRDANGNVHEVSVDFLIKISDVNSTVITKPDLTGKEVVTSTTEYGRPEDKMIVVDPNKFMGTFMNDLVIEEENSFVKIGERFLVIEELGNGSVAGRYYEEYRPEYAEYAENSEAFTFTAKGQNERVYEHYEVTTDSGTQGYMYFEVYTGKIHFYGFSGVKYGRNNALFEERVIYDDTFRRAFD